MADIRITRRGIFGATAALPLLIMAPATAGAKDHPFQRALADWRIAEAVAQAAQRKGSTPPAEANRLAVVADEKFDVMAVTPVPDAAALSLKMELIFERSEGFELADFYAQALIVDVRGLA